jgi:hypothetical protein
VGQRGVEDRSRLAVRRSAAQALPSSR